MPEFLSLTYTLPHHLVVQIEDLAEETNRSPSEVLAESFRLYLQVRQGAERRARISTVNGFAYQEVELAEAVVDEERISRLGGPAGSPGRRRPPERAPDGGPGERPAPTGDADREGVDQSRREAEPGDEDGDGDRRGHGADPEPATPAADQHAGTAVDEDFEAGAAEARAQETPTDVAEPDGPDPAEERPDGIVPEAPEHAGETAEGPTGREETVAADAGEVDAASPGTEREQPTTRPDADTAGQEEPPSTTSAGWEALANVGRRSGERVPGPHADDAEETPPEDGAADSQAADAAEALRPATRGPSPDADAAEEIRGRLLPLADEPLDSDRLRRVLEAIMREVDRKDSSADHSRKVAALARRLGKLKGLEGADLLVVEIAGLLHDIGKACVPDDLIRHVRLTKEELAFVRRYPEMGAELLGTVPALEPVAALVHSHQERWDGSGYPEGREGSQIPLGAQIVALCDIYDTLISERRYRPAYDEERAVQIIRENVGKLWNPDVASPFVRKILT